MPASRIAPTVTPQAPPGAQAVDGPRSGAAPAFPIVAIGASAGGLDACQKLFDGLGPDLAMAFIVVQHLDPKGASLLGELLSSHTALPVAEARDGAVIESGHVYVIPPGSYLSVAGNALRVTAPSERHGARLPFNFLLNSLAKSEGALTIAVILSGSGDDGSLGLQAIKAAGGVVLAQDPDEAGYDGMPRSAILTGGVDRVLPVAEIPAAVLQAAELLRGEEGESRPEAARRPALGAQAAILDQIREIAGFDFTLYKPGTLHRRIERRMLLATPPIHRLDHYLEKLKADPAEVTLLAKDLLIHVTSFFRDPKLFDILAETVVADLVKGRAPTDPIRVWVPACSSGEEAYSIAILFREAIVAAGSETRLQVFASDVDADAVATGREGLYDASIAAHVSADRLARFFSKGERGYHVTPELRSAVVFTTQNVLADPPFSRLDFVACRNLLIYLRPEAQAKAVGLFHFALKPGGTLMLGGAETVGHAEGRFAVLSKPARLYRQIGRHRAGDFATRINPDAPGRTPLRPAPPRLAPPSLAEFCRRLLLDSHAPAAALVNRARECLYSIGPIDRYLKVAPGAPSQDVLAMARHGVRGPLAAAMALAFETGTTALIPGGTLLRDGLAVAFHVEARPAAFGDETLILVCFLESGAPRRLAASGSVEEDPSRVAELEAALEAARQELETAVRGLEVSTEEQSTINEEALSVNEEFQSTNEELLTSKEELQSLNEELTALNGQLQETLDRQRTSSSDLQNILYSTDVATVFLDVDLKIRFFTPATHQLFNVLPSDIGRPFSDLSALAPDSLILSDAAHMLATLVPVSREVQTARGAWYLRRVTPYRGEGGATAGVVITYTDVTERKETSKQLESAVQAAENANKAKSRFLAAASHDLRQPLQTLKLIHGLLERKAQGEAERQLIALQEQCLNAMGGMLDTLLDINQIDAGVVQAEKIETPINLLLDELRGAFAYHAQAKGLRFRVAPCSLTIVTDPALLEQILRNLIANAVKYTLRGQVLVGCRRHADHLTIEVHDTGIGIPADEQAWIFEEYHQVANPARERSGGLGLGLSIVKRLADLLGHPVAVRSRPGQGSVFTVEVELGKSGRMSAVPLSPSLAAGAGAPRRLGVLLVVEDDPDVRRLLDLLLKEEGHSVFSTHDGASAVDLVESGAVRPDLILADYNLPGGMTGLDVVRRLAQSGAARCPVVVLTGDISTETLRAIHLEHGVPLHKPVRPEALLQLVRDLLPPSVVKSAPRAAAAPDLAAAPVSPLVYVVDDDGAVREAIRLVLTEEGLVNQTFADGESFLAARRSGVRGCLLLDAQLPGGLGGLEVLARLRAGGDLIPVIIITGEADVSIAVKAMRAGAADFIEKPVSADALMESLNRVLEGHADDDERLSARREAADRLAKLTPRQHDILDRVLAGHPSKNIAADLGISQRTVENHRAAIMHKTGSRSIPALARIALAGASPTRAGS
jgi:two-component system CheB/CheR fusion protein